MTERPFEPRIKVKLALEGLSLQDFRNFGMQHIAYIRAVHSDESKYYAVYSADGAEIAVLDSFDQALHAARQNDLEPVRVH